MNSENFGPDRAECVGAATKGFIVIDEMKGVLFRVAPLLEVSFRSGGYHPS